MSFYFFPFIKRRINVKVFSEKIIIHFSMQYNTVKHLNTIKFWQLSSF